MRIQKFNTLLAKESRPHVLKNCSLVIDAQNYFYDMYKKSGLSANYGGESNHFAKFLKNELGKFIEANVKCYFIFKGGSKDVEKRRNKKVTKYYEDYVSTVFMKTICRQVLEEMGFDYVICELEAKEHCVALANKLQFPTMSNDIEIGILSNSYINYYQGLNLNPTNKGLECKLLRFSNFLKKYNLTTEKFSVFILVTDTTIYPEGFFADFLKRFEVRNSLPAQYTKILAWLSSQSKDEALKEVTKTFQPKERNDILLKEKDILKALRTPPSLGIPYHYFFNKHQIRIMNNDPQWFEKGIALRYIAIPYINLYTQGIIDGDWSFRDSSRPDALLLSADIIKYALNLLSNYSRDAFRIDRDNGESINISTKMPDVPKPDYTVSSVVFEDGWDRVGKLRLLEHFYRHTIRGANWEYLQALPSEARLLMVALVYMAHQSDTWGERETYSVLLSFAALCNIDIDMEKLHRDCALRDLTLHYMSECEIDKTLIFPMFQFQHCLEHMNYLNALCGYQYKPTIYSKTCNSKLIYNVLKKLNESDVDPLFQISQMLKSAPTVVNFIKKLVGTYKRIMPFRN